MKKFFFCFLLCAGVADASPPNVLSNTDHIVSDVISAISILTGTSYTVDQTCPTGGSGYSAGSTCGLSGSFIPASIFPSYAINSVVNEYTANTATVVNNAPYGVINLSGTGYTLQGYDQLSYAALTANNTLFMTAYCGGPGSGDTYPPVAVSTILPNTTGPLTGSSCGYATGVEFSMTAGYKGFATGSPSGTTEAMSGVFAVLKNNHPTWTWADIKAALRQTASNWATGYTALNSTGPAYGFGNINYDTANAIATTASIFLQAPGMLVAPHGYYVAITLYPFLTARRVKEVVYVGGTWPAASTVNELTAAQIASAGGTLIYTSNGTDVTPQFNYSPSATGSATLRALTLDASGNGSRVESYTPQTASFVIGTACLQ
jgi:hypothetical protein